jgi:hypothetical protein
MSKQSFDSRDKTHRAAIAAKNHAQTGSGQYRIPNTIDAATKAEAIRRQVAQHKRHKTTKPQQPEEN